VNGSTIVNRIDMSYLGVCDVWFNEIGEFLICQSVGRN
jgi:hypothetical protein